MIITKTVRAIEQYKPKTVVLGGGVSANDALRNGLLARTKHIKGVKIHIPEKQYTTDNAAMIGAAAYFTKNKFKSSWRSLAANPAFEI